MEREREREEDAIVWKIVREGRREMESGGGGYMHELTCLLVCPISTVKSDPERMSFKISFSVCNFYVIEENCINSNNS